MDDHRRSELQRGRLLGKKEGIGATVFFEVDVNRVGRRVDEGNDAWVKRVVGSRGDCYRRLERFDEARAAFFEAVQLTDNLVEREYMLAQIEQLTSGRDDITS